MGEEFTVPAAYILSSKCPPTRVLEVRRVLCISPIYTVLFHDVYDLELALQFSSLITYTANEVDSIALALQSFREDSLPSLVIGSATLLDALYEDGKREQLLWQDQYLTGNSVTHT